MLCTLCTNKISIIIIIVIVSSSCVVAFVAYEDNLAVLACVFVVKTFPISWELADLIPGNSGIENDRESRAPGNECPSCS